MDVSLTTATAAALYGLKAANTNYQDIIGNIVEAITPDTTSLDIPADTVDISSIAAALSAADTASAGVEINAKLVQQATSLNNRVLDLLV